MWYLFMLFFFSHTVMFDSLWPYGLHFSLKNLHIVFCSGWTNLYSQWFPSLYIFVNTCYLFFLNYNHSNRCKVISHLWFWYAFPWLLVMLSIFWCICWPFEDVLWNIVWSVCVFLSWFGFLLLLWSCMSILHAFLYWPSSNIWFANIFSHSAGCLFILVIIYFICRSFLIWCSPTCWFLFLLIMLLMLYPKYHCQDKCQGAYSQSFPM